jgi:hypothetical protein
LVRIVLGWCRGFLDPNVEDEAAEVFDLVEQPIREVPQFTISGHVVDGEEAGSLLFPYSGVLTRPLDLELEELALALKESRPEPAYLRGRQHESREAEYRTVLVSWVRAADVGTDMSELIKVGEARQPQTSKHESPRRSAGLGKRAIRACPEPATSSDHGKQSIPIPVSR